MLKNIFIAVGLALAGFLVYASTLPEAFEVKRSIDIKATPAQVFVNLQDFRQWAAWSPWEKMDPAMQRTFDGAASGVGAIYLWKGNDKVGEGRMEITSAATPTQLLIRLDFIEPFPASNIAEFTLEQHDNVTTVTWAMRGKHSKLSKLVSAVMDMDSMVGPDFEQGLVNLKAYSEQTAAAGAEAHVDVNALAGTEEAAAGEAAKVPDAAIEAETE